MRRRLVAGNWKMHHLTRDALRFAEVLPAACDRWSDVDVALFPPATLLPTLARALSGSRVRLGGQNCHEAREGPYTGEVSAVQLADVGCSLVLVGHSERRRLFGESDATLARKLRSVVDAGLTPVLCVGESDGERRSGGTEEVLRRQLHAALEGVGRDQVGALMLAYEPVWAIGTGHTATPEAAGAAHAFLRSELAQLFGEAVAGSCRILYGGSVKPGNLTALLERPDVDGGLVGGASLDPDSFVGLMEAASRLRPRPV